MSHVPYPTSYAPAPVAVPLAGVSLSAGKGLVFLHGKAGEEHPLGMTRLQRGRLRVRTRED